jgi:hypothetical protein
MSADEWFFKTTSSGRFPVCELETALPFPLAPSDSLEEFARLFGPTGVSGEMLEKMSARDGRDRERGGGGYIVLLLKECAVFPFSTNNKHLKKPKNDLTKKIEKI